MASLKGKVIIVTGAAGAAGSVTVNVLAARGAGLALADMDDAVPKEVADEIRK